MKYLGIFFCVVWICLHYRAFHLYMRRCVDLYDNKLGWRGVLGVRIGILVSFAADAFAWYWLFKLLGI